MFIKKSNKVNPFEKLDTLRSLPYEEWVLFINENNDAISQTAESYLKTHFKSEKAFDKFIFALHIADMLGKSFQDNLFNSISSYLMKAVVVKKKNSTDIQYDKLKNMCKELNVNSMFFKLLCNQAHESNKIMDSLRKHYTSHFYYSLYRDVFDLEFQGRLKSISNPDINKHIDLTSSSIVMEMVKRGIYKLRFDSKLSLPLFPYSFDKIIDSVPKSHLENRLFLDKLRNRLSYILESRYQDLAKSTIVHFNNYNNEGNSLENVNLILSNDTLIEDFTSINKNLMQFECNLTSILSSYERYLLEVNELIEELKINLSQMTVNEFLDWHNSDRVKRHSLNNYSKRKKISAEDRFIREQKYELHYSVKNALRSIKKEYIWHSA